MPLLPFLFGFMGLPVPGIEKDHVMEPWVDHIMRRFSTDMKADTRAKSSRRVQSFGYGRNGQQRQMKLSGSLSKTIPSPI